MRNKNHYRPGNSIKRISIAVLTLLCFLVVMRPEAFAGGSKDDSDTYMVRIWSRGSIQDSDGKTISDTPEDSLLLRMESGETYEVGFSTYDLTAKPGTVFYVSARNLKRYTFYEAYTLDKPGSSNWQYLSKEEIQAINNGEELRYTMPDGPFLLCFVVKIDENVPLLSTPTPTPAPTLTPTTTITPTPAEDAWDITVIGGHAEDENRNVITSARPGTTVVVIHDGRERQYFTSWIANDSPLPENTPVFKFVMPKHAVEYHAVTTQKQKPGVLDLSISPLTVRENRELFLNALLSFDHYSYPYFDLDRDGNFDLRIQEEEDRILIYKEKGYSLGTSYVWNGSYAFLGPITVTTTEEAQPDLIPTLTAGASIEDIPSPYVPTEIPYGSDKVSKTDSGDDGTFDYRILIIVLAVLGVLGLVILVGVKIKQTPPTDSGNNDMYDWRKERVILNAGSGSEIILTESQESSNENEADDSKDGDSE